MQLHAIHTGHQPNPVSSAAAALSERCQSGGAARQADHHGIQLLGQLGCLHGQHDGLRIGSCRQLL